MEIWSLLVEVYSGCMVAVVTWFMVFVLVKSQYITSLDSQTIVYHSMYSLTNLLWSIYQNYFALSALDLTWTFAH